MNFDFMLFGIAVEGRLGVAGGAILKRGERIVQADQAGCSRRNRSLAL